MQGSGREPSMEDILASIKKVIAEEKELRSATAPIESVEDEPLPEESASEETEVDILELDEPLAPEADLGPPLLDEDAAGHSREALEQLQTIAATIPAVPPINPLEDMIREMLRPILKQWLDEHLPHMIDEHVKREISRITGRPL
jgi:cell pole-organizing protein PopZ